MEKGCDTCRFYSDLDGECKKGLASQFESRSCDTSKCESYELDKFYADLDGEIL